MFKMAMAAAICVVLLVSGCGRRPGEPCCGGAAPAVGGYFEPCATGGCAPSLTCMNGPYGVERVCVWPIDDESCGRDGEPCCATRNSDGSVAPPCLAKGQCGEWCTLGLRCDFSHRTGDLAVCVHA
jgi:hypothetical protein